MNLERRVEKLEQATQPRSGKVLRIVIDEDGETFGDAEMGIVIVEKPRGGPAKDWEGFRWPALPMS